MQCWISLNIIPGGWLGSRHRLTPESDSWRETEHGPLAFLWLNIEEWRLDGIFVLGSVCFLTHTAYSCKFSVCSCTEIYSRGCLYWQSFLFAAVQRFTPEGAYTDWVFCLQLYRDLLQRVPILTEFSVCSCTEIYSRGCLYWQSFLFAAVQRVTP